jgi:hypothetical protein
VVLLTLDQSSWLSRAQKNDNCSTQKQGILDNLFQGCAIGIPRAEDTYQWPTNNFLAHPVKEHKISLTNVRLLQYNKYNT